jgi:hypothetical protein
MFQLVIGQSFIYLLFSFHRNIAIVLAKLLKGLFINDFSVLINLLIFEEVLLGLRGLFILVFGFFLILLLNKRYLSWSLVFHQRQII